MGIKVSASQAAELVRHHERVVRRRLAHGDLPCAQKDAQGHWAIDVDDLATIPGWVVDPERLAMLQAADGRSRSSLLAKVDTALATVASIERRLTALERAIRALRENDALRSPSDGRETAGGYADIDTGAATRYDRLNAAGDVLASDAPPASHIYGLSPDARHILSDLPTPRVVALADRGAGAPLTFRYRSDAARWLVRHASPLDEASPKSWHGWRDVEMTPAGVLRFALALQRDAEVTRNHRIGWRLHVCEDPACVCHELLAE